MTRNLTSRGLRFGPLSNDSTVRTSWENLLRGYYGARFFKGVQFYGFKLEMRVTFTNFQEENFYSVWDEKDKAKHLAWFLSRLKRLELLETVYVVEINDSKVDRDLDFQNSYIRLLELQVVVGIRSLMGKNEVLGHNVFACFSETDLIKVTGFTELFSVNEIFNVLDPYFAARLWHKHELVSFGNALNFESFVNYNVSIFGENFQPPNCFRYLSGCRTLLKRDTFHQYTSYPAITGIKADGPSEVVLLYFFKVFFYLNGWVYDRETASVFSVSKETGERKLLGPLDKVISTKLNTFILPEMIKLFPMHLDLYNFDHLLGFYLAKAIRHLVLYPEVFLEFQPINVYDNKTGIMFSSLVLGSEVVVNPFGPK